MKNASFRTFFSDFLDTFQVLVFTDDDREFSQAKARFLALKAVYQRGTSVETTRRGRQHQEPSKEELNGLFDQD